MSPQKAKLKTIVEVIDQQMESVRQASDMAQSKGRADVATIVQTQGMVIGALVSLVECLADMIEPEAREPVKLEVVKN